MAPRLTVIDGGQHHARDTRPIPESIVGDDGQPADLLGRGQRYPLAAECADCGERITLASRSILAEWEHVDGAPPPRHPAIPPPRPVR